jgi:hypothetical protein
MKTYVLMYEDETGNMEFVSRVEAKDFESAELVLAEDEEALEEQTLPYFVCEEVRSIDADYYLETSDASAHDTTNTLQ